MHVASVPDTAARARSRYATWGRPALGPPAVPARSCTQPGTAVQTVSTRLDAKRHIPGTHCTETVRFCA
eukprot:159038-Rhodomonas_salina.2